MELLNIWNHKVRTWDEDNGGHVVEALNPLSSFVTLSSDIEHALVAKEIWLVLSQN